MVADFYIFSNEVAESLIQIHDHKNASSFVKAAVLENANNRHGFLELKEEQLRRCSGDVVGCAALMGLRNVKPAKRNILGKYAARSGPHMKMYADIVSKI